jgi:hypothetical protein
MTIIQTKGLAVILILTLGFLLSSSAVVYPIWRGRSLSSFLVLSMAWTFFPYFILALVYWKKSDFISTLVSGTVMLGFDVYIHWRVLIKPTSSTSAVSLVFSPLWLLLIVFPLSYIICYKLRGQVKR